MGTFPSQQNWKKNIEKSLIVGSFDPPPKQLIISLQYKSRYIIFIMMLSVVGRFVIFTNCAVKDNVHFSNTFKNNNLKWTY